MSDQPVDNSIRALCQSSVDSCREALIAPSGRQIGSNHDSFTQISGQLACERLFDRDFAVDYKISV